MTHFCSARLCSFKLLHFSITGKMCMLSKMIFDHTLSVYFIKVSFWTNKAPHGPHTSILQNSCKQLLQLKCYTSSENEHCAQRPGPRHALSISGQGLSDHHYRLHSAGLCVELQPFAILWGNQGIWHQLSSRTGQSKYTVSTFLKPLVIFSLEGAGTSQRTGRDGVNSGCCSDHPGH